jgi:hypothetical protein
LRGDKGLKSSICKRIDLELMGLLIACPADFYSSHSSVLTARFRNSSCQQLTYKCLSFYLKVFGSEDCFVEDN